MLARRCMAAWRRIALHQSPLRVRVREYVPRATGATCSPKATTPRRSSCRMSPNRGIGEDVGMPQPTDYLPTSLKLKFASRRTKSLRFYVKGRLRRLLVDLPRFLRQQKGGGKKRVSAAKRIARSRCEIVCAGGRAIMNGSQCRHLP
jgi:hypothetical protein